jgi:hypothetical protein
MLDHAPGSLVEQRREELDDKFSLRFDILSRDMVEAARTHDPIMERNLLIAGLDQLSRAGDLRDRLAHRLGEKEPATSGYRALMDPLVDNPLADACDAWQSGRDGGSTPIRAAARVLTGVPHYFRAPYINELDGRAAQDETLLARAQCLLDAIAVSSPMDAAQWAAQFDLECAGHACRGIKANPGADEQIEALVNSSDAAITMPLWGFSLSEEMALSYGTRFMFRVHGPFHAIAAWQHSGVNADEQELIGSGHYRVLETRRDGDTLIVDLEEQSLIRLR